MCSNGDKELARPLSKECLLHKEQVLLLLFVFIVID